jgi:hypothetical protein
MESEWMTTAETKRRLRCSTPTLHKLRRMGVLTAYNLPTKGKRLYALRDVEALVSPVQGSHAAEVLSAAK